MSCKKIKKQLLLFLDNELPEALHQEIQHHLAGCSSCSDHLKKVASIWECPADVETIEPSPWLWTELPRSYPHRKTGRIGLPVSGNR